MRTLLKIGFFIFVMYCLFSYTNLELDKEKLKNDLIRMHVVANSDSEEDQNIKLKVKDAIVSYLQPAMENITDKEEARLFIENNLDNVEQIANQVLKELGINMTVKATLTEEEFGVRHYDTFSLPSGIYDSLRVQIGEGAGQNWWCVAFPTLCTPATTAEFTDRAVSSGFSDSLVSTLTEKEGFEVRFYFLDLLGRMENFFH